MYSVDLWYLLIKLEKKLSYSNMVKRVEGIVNSLKTPENESRVLSEYQAKKFRIAMTHADCQDTEFMLHDIQDMLYNEGDNNHSISLLEHMAILSVLNCYKRKES